MTNKGIESKVKAHETVKVFLHIVFKHCIVDVFIHIACIVETQLFDYSIFVDHFSR